MIPSRGLYLTETKAFWNGCDVELSTVEHLMIALLARKAGEDVSLLQLHEAFRGPNFAVGDGPDGYKTNIRSHLKRIRSKFKKADPGFKEIETRNGSGYSWLDPKSVAQNAPPAESIS